MPITTYGLAAMGYPDPATPWTLPDLPDLYDQNFLNVGLDRLTGRWGLLAGAGPHELQQWLNLVRLSDKSIRCIRAAKASLAEYAQGAHNGQVSPFYRAVDSLEDAVSASFRAVLAAEALQPHVARGLRKPTQRQRDLLRLTRNRIEHIDEKVAKRRSAGHLEMHFLLPTPTAVEIDGLRLPYRDLASVINKSHANVETLRQAPSQ